MPTCPAGHDSASSDFCDVCGSDRASASRGGDASGVTAVIGSQPAAPAEPCPLCGTARSGRFCESCGFDLDSGNAPSTSAPSQPVAAE